MLYVQGHIHVYTIPGTVWGHLVGVWKYESV